MPMEAPTEILVIDTSFITPILTILTYEKTCAPPVQDELIHDIYWYMSIHKYRDDKYQDYEPGNQQYEYDK